MPSYPLMIAIADNTVTYSHLTGDLGLCTKRRGSQIILSAKSFHTLVTNDKDTTVTMICGRIWQKREHLVAELYAVSRTTEYESIN